ncbi:MAG TPA: hypothetical protein VL485_32065 [Ktedonobacteraceae bacterium]|jgi:WD40 repeat protein|nr:hypothetical protein [Ktedonobacteraceae bacterium]
MDWLQNLANVTQILAFLWTLGFGGQSLLQAYKQRKSSGKSLKIHPRYWIYTGISVSVVFLLGIFLRPIFLPLDIPFSHPTINLTSHPVGTILFSLKGNFTTEAWSPNGQYLALGTFDTTSTVGKNNGIVKIYDAITGKTVHTYHGHANAITAIAWSPNNNLIASGDTGGQVQIWNAKTDENIYTNTYYHLDRYFSSPVVSVAWSHNGKRVASAYLDGTVQAWNIVDGTNIYTYNTADSQGVQSMAWSSDGKYIAAGSENGTIQIWDAATKETITSYQSHSDSVNALSWSQSGKYLASGSHDTTVLIWNIDTREVIFTYKGHAGSVSTVAWSPDGKRIASASTDRTVQVWDATDGGHLYTFEKHSKGVIEVAWSPDGKYLASIGNTSEVEVWQAG